MSTRRKSGKRTKPTRYLRPAEAARMVGIHPDTLARWVDGGRHRLLTGAAMRHPDGHRRYRLDKIEAYVASVSA